MSNNNWISLHNVAVRVCDPDENRSDREIEISRVGWPQLNLDNDDLEQFLFAAVNGDILARGQLTKICIHEYETFVPKDNREFFTQRLNEDRSFKASSKLAQPVDQYPFVIGRAIETNVTNIPANFWQKHGQLWQHNQLVGFGYSPSLADSETLKPSLQISSNLAGLGLESSEYMQTHDMPEIYLYEQVEIEENTLNLWADNGRCVSSDNNLAKWDNSHKGRGTKRDERWPDIIAIVEEFISSKELFESKVGFGHKLFQKLDKKYMKLQKISPEKTLKIRKPMDPFGLLISLRVNAPELYKKIIKQIANKSN